MSQDISVTIVKPKGSVIGAILLMSFISLLLCWLPVAGPLIAGLIGGKKAGGVGNALIAVLLPAVILAAALFALAGSFSGVPIVGAIAGVGGFVFALSGVGPLLVGALLGGAMA